MRIVWIDPNFFYLYPNSIQTGGVVQFCQDDRRLVDYLPVGAFLRGSPPKFDGDCLFLTDER